MATPAKSFPVALLDEFYKVNPITGSLLEQENEHYSTFNETLFETKRPDQAISYCVTAARNETIGFQLIVPSEFLQGKKCSIHFKGFAKPFLVKAYREWYHKIGNAWYPDGLIPLETKKAFSLLEPNNHIPEQKFQAFYIELFMDPELKQKQHTGWCILNGDGGRKVQIEIRINLLDFALPSRPSFCVEYNNFGSLSFSVNRPVGNDLREYQGSRDFDKELLSYHRLSREHYGNLNVLPYNQHGLFAPELTPLLDHRYRIKDFSAYDKRFGPFLSGKAFESGYGKGIPVSEFYLPFSLTWPAPYHYFPSPEYQSILTENIKAFEQHFKNKGWTQTDLHVMLNHKSRRSSFPFNTDEPTRIKDYGMIRYYGEAINRGKSSKSPIHFRLDIGHYECDHVMDACDWIGEDKVCVSSKTLNGLSKFWVINYCHAQSASLKRRRRLGEKPWVYLGASMIHRPCSDMCQLLLNAYRIHAAGFCFWSCNSWEGNPWVDAGKHFGFDYLIYPGQEVGIKAALPSLRMKLARRAVMDIEYLEQMRRMGRSKKADAILDRLCKNFDPESISMMDEKDQIQSEVKLLRHYGWAELRRDLIKGISG